MAEIRLASRVQRIEASPTLAVDTSTKANLNNAVDKIEKLLGRRS